MKEFTTTIGTTQDTFEFYDTDIPNSGTAALDQFNAKQTIHSFVMDDNVRTEVYIPFHAINFLYASADIVEDSDTFDANCDDPCEGLTAVYWNNGSTVPLDTTVGYTLPNDHGGCLFQIEDENGPIETTGSVSDPTVVTTNSEDGGYYIENNATVETTITATLSARGCSISFPITCQV